MSGFSRTKGAFSRTNAHDPSSSSAIELTLTEGTSMAAVASPDRRTIAIDLIGRLWIVPMSGGAARQLTPDLLEARQPSWSPDGARLAFQGYGDDGVWHIYAIRPDGSGLTALTSGVFDDREPAWARDGRTIAFSSDRAGGKTTIWQLTVATGAVRQLSTRDGWMPSWTPDGAGLYFVSADVANGSQRAGVYLRDPSGRDRLVWDARESGLPAAVAAAPGESDRRGPLFAMSAGGEALAYLSVDGRRITPDEEDVFPFRPQWLSHDELLYTADGHIKRRRIESDQSAVVPFSATVTLQRPTYTIAHRRLDSAGPQRAAGIVAPAVSPDGRAIAFAALGDLYLLPVGSRTPVQLTDDPFVESDPAWSPDGRELVFVSDRDGTKNLWVRDMRTSVERQITFSRDAALSGPAWSPDGTHIAYLADRFAVGLVRVRPGGGNLAAIARPVTQLGEFGRPAWLADSRSVAVGALFPYSNRYREGLNEVLIEQLDPPGWRASVVVPDHSAGNRQSQGPVWSPDGLHAAYVSEGQLWTVRVNADGAPTDAPRSIASDEPDWPTWEGDSTHLVYLTPHGFRRALADGSPPQAIACDLPWQPRPPSGRLVVHAGHVFTATYDGQSNATDIVIDRGVIVEVADHRDDLHAGVVIDASDEIVMPGLVDMHTHLDPDYGEALGRIWLAYGVTSVRNPSQHPTIGLEMREAYDSGRRIGPRVFLSGQAFDGPRVFYPGYMTIASNDQLSRALDAASAYGVDFFKTYVRLPDRFQRRIVEYAHGTAQRPVTSHELYPAAAFGVEGVEHLRGTSRRGYSTKVSTTDRSYRDVVDTLAQGAMTLTPTIGIQGGFATALRRDPSMVRDARISLFPPRVRAQLAADASAPERRDQTEAVLRYGRTAAAIVKAGGVVVSGTDSPLVPYGLSLHVELQTLVDAGLTPYQALLTATLNAARTLGVDDELGTIEPGKRADLVFLGGDPLTDIRNTRDVRRVMKGGMLFEMRELIRR